MVLHNRVVINRVAFLQHFVDLHGIIIAMQIDPVLDSLHLIEGIQKWKDTTMLDPSLVTDYWYIRDITPDDGISYVDPIRTESIKALHFNMLRMRITSV